MIFKFITLFFVLVAVLLIERFFDCSRFRAFGWVERYHNIIDKRFAGKNGMLIVLIMLVPITLVVSFIEFNLRLWLYGVLGIVFEFAMLLYCMGPRSAWQDVETMKSSVDSDTNQLAILDVESTSLFSGLWMMFERRVLSPIFWFILLGAGGVFFYRITEVSARLLSKKSETAQFAAKAKSLLNGLDWLPVRINTFIFALAGHFSLVITDWKKALRPLPSDNEAMLAKCGNAGIGISEANAPALERASFIKEAVGLIERSLIIFMAILGVLVLAV